jgi:prepilin-type N-terminal cleavage/methylation domain-containing protein
MVEHGLVIQISPGGKMFKKIKTDFGAATFRILRLLLSVTIWSCHVLVAPAFRLCHGLAVATFGFRDLRTDRKKIAAAILQVKTFRNLSLRRVKRLRGVSEATPEISRLAPIKLHNPINNDIATPPVFAMTCQESDSVRMNHSKLFQLRSRAARIASIPRTWAQGAKGSRVQEKIMIKSEPSNPRPLDPFNPSGFTLIEVIAVMIIIGILAAILLSKIDFGATSSRASADGAAYMVASDIRYAQEWAMANRVSKSIQFSTAAPANKYTFSPVSAGMDPSGQLSGATIGTIVTFTFNSLGEPTVGGGSFVRVSAGGVTKTITVLQYTGKINIS